MAKVNVGIIGCGDVTERKSGPAFNKVGEVCVLTSVMRRNLAKSQDYASRHGVPHYYDDAMEMITSGHINTVYIATPPSTHLEYARAAIDSGIQYLYIEKPLGLTSIEARSFLQECISVKGNEVKCVVAHYRRALPMFVRIKELIHGGALGAVRFVNIRLWKSKMREMSDSSVDWRTDPSVSGGGHFHDLSPHQLVIDSKLLLLSNLI